MSESVTIGTLPFEVEKQIPSDISEALDDAWQAVAALGDRAKSAALAEISVPGLLAWLRVLRQISSDVADLDATLTRHLYMVAEHGHGDYGEGLGGVWVTRTRAGESWDERGAVAQVIEARMRERGGEAPEPELVAEWLLEAGSFGYFRKTALRGLGIDVDTVYESRPGKPSVKFDA